MKRVNVIFHEANSVKRKKRIAVYARVSSSSEEQLESLEAQKNHYEQYVNSQSDWKLVDIYYDEGISGTSLKKRTGLNHLIEDCEKGLVDMIITKSISRFTRNTVDCLSLVRRLLAYNVSVKFEKENIQTDNMDDELMLSILAELTANESRNISENEKWAIQKRFRDGIYIISYPPYGYQNKDGKMMIVPKEAQVVQNVFQWSIEGMSTASIAKRLNEQGIVTKRKKKWVPSVISGMLKNEKYVGDVLFQKYYTDENFVRHRNYGDKDMYYVEDHHEAIVSRELFDTANEMLKQRGLEKGITSDRRKYQQRYALSGKVICTECGETFKRRTHTTTYGKYTAWCCGTHIEDKTKCGMKYIEETAIQAAFMTMMNKLLFSKEVMLKPLQVAVLQDNSQSDETKLAIQQSELENIQRKLDEAQHLFQQEYLNYVSYQNLETTLMNDRERILKGIQYQKMMDSKKTGIIQGLNVLMERLNARQYWESYDEELFSEVVDKVKVISRQSIQFELKCGLTLEERLD